MRNSYIVLASPRVQVLDIGYSPSQGDETTLFLSQVLQVSPTHNNLIDALGKETMVTTSQLVATRDNRQSRITHIDYISQESDVTLRICHLIEIL